MDAEESRGIGPMLDGAEAGVGGEVLELHRAVFAGIFGVDALAGAEADGASGHHHDLIREAPDINLDAAFRYVVEGVVSKAIKVEICIELAVDPLEQIKIKGRADAGAVVVGGIE